MTEPKRPKRALWRRVLTNRWLLLYFALLVASHAFVAWRSTRARTVELASLRTTVTVPELDDAGPTAGPAVELSVIRWSPTPSAPASARPRLPIVLLHGTPSGGGADFRAFAPRLAEAGYEVIAPDLPGFGSSSKWVPSYSILANARYTLAVMDALDIERAHILGWSQGGGTALWVADLAPERVASLNLMASIGVQETEGSGDRFFEQAKYRIGQFLFLGVVEAVPHFGLVGPRWFRHAFLHNFLDTDLRPMREVMERLQTPTLILHGRHDFLTPAWGAELHHDLIEPSTLVMLDGDHFMPLPPPMGKPQQTDQAVAHTLVHAERHDDPSASGLRGEAIFASPDAHIANKLVGIELSRSTRWWVIILLIVAATFVSEDLATITVGLLIASQALDWGVGLIGCFIAIVLGDFALWALGRFLGRRVLKWPIIRGMVTEESLERWARVFDKHTGKAVILSRFLPGTRLPTYVAAGILAKQAHHFLMWVLLAAVVWTPFLLLMTLLIGPRLLEVFRTVFHGPWAIVAAIVAVFLVIRFIGYETTAQGRDRLKRDLKLLVSPEFWPAWLFYLPWVPQYLWLSLRHGGPMVFTCANPGLSNGGGLIGESKSAILDGFRAAKDWVLPWAVIPDGGSPEARARKALDILRDRPELGGLPVVLKPDFAYRGLGMRIARSEHDVHEYFRHFAFQVQMQRYHPGPHELGVMWARVPDASRRVDDWRGEVLSATDKTFPVIEGDGKHTLEILVWNHPRYRMQARVFLKRHAAVLDRVLAKGERMVLARAGNHCQGTMFSDGMPKVSPALAARIDEISRSFAEPGTGRRADFGRFDIRFEDPEALRNGEGFAVVEFNGTSSEPTSMYDPRRPVWGWTLLLRHWRRLFAIGAARRREGVAPLSIAGALALWRANRPTDPAVRISD